jgi:hypothetical protein
VLSAVSLNRSRSWYVLPATTGALLCQLYYNNEISVRVHVFLCKSLEVIKSTASLHLCPDFARYKMYLVRQNVSLYYYISTGAIIYYLCCILRCPFPVNHDYELLSYDSDDEKKIIPDVG